VNSTGTLGGNGTISGAVTVNAGGSLAPGSATATIGTLTLGGSLTLATNGTPEARVLLDVASANGNVGAAYIDANGSNWFASLPASDPLFTGLGSGSHDLINLTNSASTLSFDTNGRLSLTTTGSYSWQLGDILNLFDWAAGVNVVQNGFNPAVDIVNLPSLSAGLGWDTSRFLQTGALGVVPEPSRALLLFLGVFGLLFRRRRE